MPVEAELLRQAAGGGGLVPWELVADLFSATGRADPTLDSSAKAARVSQRDIPNEQTAALGAGAIWETPGPATYIAEHGTLQILYAALTPLASVSIVWYSDPTTPLGGLFGSSVIPIRTISGYQVAYSVQNGLYIAPYYKLHVVNGSTPQGPFPSFISINWMTKDTYNGAFDFLDAQLTQLSRALLTRAVLAGVTPDGLFNNVTLNQDTSLRVGGTPLTLRIDQDSQQRVAFIGKATPGSDDDDQFSTAWTIFKLSYTGGNTTPDSVKYITNKAWKLRAAYTYQ